MAIDGVFDATPTGGIVFHAATELDANAIAGVRACVRRRLLCVFVRCGLLPRDDARAMGQWQHEGGLSVNGSQLLTSLADARQTLPPGAPMAPWRPLTLPASDNNQDHSTLSAKKTVEAVLSGSTDKGPIWAVNVDDEYQVERP